MNLIIFSFAFLTCSLALGFFSFLSFFFFSFLIIYLFIEGTTESVLSQVRKGLKFRMMTAELSINIPAYFSGLILLLCAIVLCPLDLYSSLNIQPGLKILFDGYFNNNYGGCQTLLILSTKKPNKHKNKPAIMA